MTKSTTSGPPKWAICALLSLCVFTTYLFILSVTDAICLKDNKPQNIILIISKRAPFYLKGKDYLLKDLVKRFRISRHRIFTYIMDDWEDRKGQLTTKIKKAHPGVILAIGSPAAEFAKRLSIPQVFMMVLDPKNQGLKTQLSTGISLKLPISKRLDVMAGILPGKRIGLLYCCPIDIKSIERAARKRGLQLVALRLDGSHQVPWALDTMLANKIKGLIMIPDPSIYENPKIVSQVLLWGLRYKIGVMGLSISYVRQGALLAIEPDYSSVASQAATMAIRILKGWRPKYMPIQDPKAYCLSVNLKTAKRVEVKIPKKILDQAILVIR